MSYFRDLLTTSHAVRRAAAIPLELRRRLVRNRMRPAYECLHRLEEISAGDAILNLADYRGTFAISHSSSLFWRIALTGSYEPEIAKLFVNHLVPDQDVLDVGANVGLFTVLAGKALRSGRVLAVEPTSPSFNRLTSNVTRNGLSDSAILLKTLVSSKEGTGKINVVVGREEYSSMQRPAHSGIGQADIVSEAVPIRTLDCLVAEHGLRPRLIKIDVEGGEVEAFRGAKEVLSTHRPYIISELDDDTLAPFRATSADFVDLFESFDYEVTTPFNPSASPRWGRAGMVLCAPK